jgi:hypothetical protein
MRRAPTLAERVGAIYGRSWRIEYGDDLPIGLVDLYGNDFAVAACEAWCVEDDRFRRIARCGRAAW